MKKLTVSVKLALLLVTTAVHAQQAAPVAPSAPAPATNQPDELSCLVLTGRVTDPFAYPLTGATVMLRSPKKGFTPDAFSTNSEGQYIVTSKQPIPRNTIIEIRAAGYDSQELPLTNCQPLDITLAPLEGTRFKANGRIKKTRMTGKIR